jgi:hypothetical protein
MVPLQQLLMKVLHREVAVALPRIAPNLTRAAVIRDPAIVSTGGMMGTIQAVAPSLGVELSPVDSREPETVERGVATNCRCCAGSSANARRCPLSS